MAAGLGADMGFLLADQVRHVEALLRGSGAGVEKFPRIGGAMR